MNYPPYLRTYDDCVEALTGETVVLEFPNDAQRDAAAEIQQAFDGSNLAIFFRKVSPWLTA